MELVDRINSFSPSSLSARLLAAGGAAVMAAGAGVIAYFDPTKTTFLPVCPLLRFSGFACPGCGLTRAFHALFHADIIPALDFNLLVPLWAALFAWIFISLSVLAARGRGLRSEWLTRPGLLMGLLGILIGFGVVRNIPAWPFTILFP